MLGVVVAAAARLGEVPPVRGNPSMLIFRWYCAHHVQLKQLGAWILAVGAWRMTGQKIRTRDQNGRGEVGSEEVLVRPVVTGYLFFFAETSYVRFVLARDHLGIPKKFHD